MVVDFQQHYTPSELLKGDRSAVSVQLDQNGNPSYLLNPLLADLKAHVRMMDRAGIDAGVLSCGSGFDHPELVTCRLINDCMKAAVDEEDVTRTLFARFEITKNLYLLSLVQPASFPT